MKLDIGSAEGPVEADVHLDYSMDYLPYTEEELGFKPVDILADAHRLPFRNNLFDEVRAGSILIVYTGTDAVDEAFRVLKQNGKLEAVLQLPLITTFLDATTELGVVNDIETINTNITDDSIFDVRILMTKNKYTDWDNPPWIREVDYPRRQIV